jgi:hypothetical protein
VEDRSFQARVEFVDKILIRAEVQDRDGNWAPVDTTNPDWRNKIPRKCKESVAAKFEAEEAVLEDDEKNSGGPSA